MISKLLDGRHFPILMVVPAFALIAVVVLFPILYAVWLSMFDWSPLIRGEQPFIGLGNYARMLADPVVWISLGNTLYYVAISVVLEMAVGFGLALVLHHQFLGVGLLRTIITLPLFIVPVVIAIMWRLLLNQDFGPIFHVMNAMGLVSPNQFGLSNPALAMPIVAAISVWQVAPFVFLIFVAGLQAVPREQYEAARIDGASVFQEFTQVTLPFLQPLILFVLLFRIMESFKVFDLVMLLTGGGPGTNTEVLNLYIYRQAFQYSSMGYASALSVAALIFILLLSVVLIKLLDKDRTV